MWDTTTVTKPRHASGKRLRNQDGGTSRSAAHDPTLSVDRNIGAANVCGKKTWMERVEQGLSKPRAQS